MKTTSHLFKLSVLAAAVLLAACNSDSSAPAAPTAQPTQTGRNSFDSEFPNTADGYDADLTFEITADNDEDFISQSLFRIVRPDYNDLNTLQNDRLTNMSGDEDDLGLEPLFQSGFESRTRNCLQGGQAETRVSDKSDQGNGALNFKPDAADSTKVSFINCKERFQPTSFDILQDGEISSRVTKYIGAFANGTNAPGEAATANFSDLLKLKTVLTTNGTFNSEVMETGRFDMAVVRDPSRYTSYISTDNFKAEGRNNQGETIATLTEQSQRELTRTNGVDTLRFQIRRVGPLGGNVNPVDKSYVITSEEGRSINPDKRVVAGNYPSAGDPYHPEITMPFNPSPFGLTDGGMVAKGGNGSIELVFNQEAVGEFRNITRVIRTVGGVITHDCKVPYFTVFPSEGRTSPRFSFDPASSKCLVDGQPFPPVMMPPPPTPPVMPPQPTCLLTDLLGAIQAQDPSPLSSTLSGALLPVTDPLCEAIAPLNLSLPM